jgi:hypothetical protein
MFGHVFLVRWFCQVYFWLSPFGCGAAQASIELDPLEWKRPVEVQSGKIVGPTRGKRWYNLAGTVVRGQCGDLMVPGGSFPGLCGPVSTAPKGITMSFMRGLLAYDVWSLGAYWRSPLTCFETSSTRRQTFPDRSQKLRKKYLYSTWIASGLPLLTFARQLGPGSAPLWQLL